jgi:adenylate cyclase
MAYSRQIRSTASEDRLEKLISERLKSGANKELIDARIWDLFGETWAVMFTDLSGFSRQVAEFGIIHFLQVIYESQRLIVPCIDLHDGILLKMEGDSMLIIFRSVSRAVHCAIRMQQTMEAYNKSKSDSEKILLCLGVGYGRILKIGDQDVFGAEVNAASKLGEDIAKAKEILVTTDVKNALEKENFDFEKIPEIPPGSNGAYRLKYSIYSDLI